MKYKEFIFPAIIIVLTLMGVKGCFSDASAATEVEAIGNRFETALVSEIRLIRQALERLEKRGTLTYRRTNRDTQ